MPPKKQNANPEYQCPRCDYRTNHKTNISAHFYKKKKLCAAILNNIELTADIKEHVLINRIYKVIKTNETNIINQYINNSKTLNNYIMNMDTFDKLSHITNYNNSTLIDFDNQVELAYMREASRLENNDYKYGYDMKQDNILKIVDTVTKSSDSKFKDFNLLFDKRINRLKMYRSKKWESFLLDVGILELMRVVKSNILDSYEIYLIRQLNIEGGNAYEKNQYKNHLIEYYSFIALFNLPPFVMGRTDNEILNVDDTAILNVNVNDNVILNVNDNDNVILNVNDNVILNVDSIESYKLELRYMDIYNQSKLGVTNGQKNKIRKEIADIIDKNTLQNVDELNKSIMNLINSDTEFKKVILKIG